MNPIEILQKPLPKYDFKSFQVAPTDYKSPLPSVKTSVFDKISALLPPTVVDVAQKYAGPKVTPINTVSSSLPAYLKPLVAPLPKGLVQVRQQDFRDVANALPEVAGLVAQFVGGPQANAVLSLIEAKTGKEFNLKIPLFFQNQGKYPVDSPTPDWFKSQVEQQTKMSLHPQVVYGAWQNYVEQHNKKVGSSWTSETSQKYYTDQIDAGATPTKAFWLTALKTVEDMSLLVPMARNLGKLALLKTAPEKLINVEWLKTAQQNTAREISDYMTGKIAVEQTPISEELRGAISDMIKTGTREDKMRVLQSISDVQVLKANPSRLGSLLGISQQEADALLQEVYGGSVRPTVKEFVPGYRETPGQPAPVGASIKKVEKVGGETKPTIQTAVSTFKIADERTIQGGDGFSNWKQIEYKNERGDEITGSIGRVNNGEKLADNYTVRLSTGKYITKPSEVSPRQNQVIHFNSLEEATKAIQESSAKEVSAKELPPTLESLAQEARKYKSAEEFVKQRNLNGIVPEWGTKNPYLGMSQKEQLTQVLKEKPAYLSQGEISTEELQKFAEENNLSYMEANGREVVAKTQDDAMKVIDAENQRELGLALGYQDLGQTFDKKSLTDFYNKATGKQEFAKKGQNFKPTVTKEEATNIIRSMFSEKEIGLAFDPKLAEKGYQGLFKSGGTGSFGQHLKPMITLLEKNGMVDDRIAYHEAFHGHFNTFLTSTERRLMLDRVKNNPLTASYRLKTEYETADAKAEEWLADDFADYARTKQSKMGFESLWEKLLQKIRSFIRRMEGFANVYDDILNGKKGAGEPIEVKKGYFVEGYGKRPKFPSPQELTTNKKITEEANAELNRAFEAESLTNKITFLSDSLNLAKTDRDLIKQALEQHRAKDLVKYVSDQTGRLPEVTGNPTKMSLTTGKEVENTEFGVRGDDIVQNQLGFKDLDQAEASLEDYQRIKDSLKEANAQVARLNKELGLHRAFEAVIKNDPTLRNEYQATLRQIRIAERLREKTLSLQKSKGGIPSSKGGQNQAQMGQDGSFGKSIITKVSDVKPPEGRGGVTPPAFNFLKWKDRSALALSRETLERNLEAVAKEDAPQIKKFLLEPVRNNETARIEFVNKMREEIRNKIVKGYGIRAKSEDSEFIQRYGEGDQGEFPLSLDELKYRRPATWMRIKDSAEFFRNKYSDLLEMVNKERQKFGYKPIPARPDYFRHFQAIDGAIRQFGLILREQDIPTEIAGITGIFNPNKPFSTAELKRRSKKTTIDAISGMDNYLDSISRQIYHIDSVTRGRQVEKYIRESAKVGAENGLLEEQVNLPNFVSNLHDYTNILAGKKSALDRALESIIGRRIYSTTNWLRQKISANLVGGNVSSALTNFIPFTQSLATTNKMDAVRGLKEALSSPFQKDYTVIDGVRSDFLLRRFPDEGVDIRGIKKASEMANYLFKAIDQFTAKSLVSGKYYENISKGMEKTDAMRLADSYAGRVMADRSVGQLPNIFNSRSLGFLTQFQTEVNNAVSFMTKDIPYFSEGNKIKLASMLMQFIIYSFLFNEGYKRVTGRRPIFDPIYAMTTLLGFNVEYEDVAFSRRLLRASEDIGNNMPFLGILTGGRIPLSGSVPDLYAVLKGDSTLSKEAKKLLTILPPFGGGQAKKTLEGLYTVFKGKEKTPSGKSVRYKTKQTPLNYVRAALFGKSALPEAQDYYKSLDAKYAPRKKTSSANPNSSLKGIKLTPKEGMNLNLKSTNNLNGIKLVPKQKVNVKNEQSMNILNKLFGVQKAEASTGELDAETIKAEIAFRESGVSKNPYTAKNENKNGTSDYGKYQVNEQTLKTYSKKFLGKEITPQEFLKSPALQEKFMESAVKHLQSLGAKSLDAFLILWHKGWGDISTKRILKLKQDPEIKKYINNRRT